MATLLSNRLILGFVGVVPLLLISYIGMKLFDGSWTIFWIILLSIYFLFFLNWVYKSIMTWILYFVYNKNKLVDAIYADLVEYNFPPTFIGELGSVYFDSVWDNDDMAIEARLVAKEWATLIFLLRINGKYQDVFRLERAADQAIKKYSATRT